MWCSSFWSTVTGLPVPVWSSSTCLGVKTQRFAYFVSGYRFPCTRWICDLIMFLLIKSVAIKLGTLQCLFSPFRDKFPCTGLMIGYWILVRFVGCLYCFLQHQNPNCTSNYLCKKSSVVVEVPHTLSGIWLLQISSQLLSRYNKLGAYRRRWLRSILFDRTSILAVEQAVYRPCTPYLGALSTFCL